MPPCTKRTHIMRRSRTHRKIRITPCICKLTVNILRHTLNLKRQNTELIHYRRHTIRNHTQILTTCKHTCSSQQIRQLAKSRVTPKRIVTPVEEIIVQPVESILLPIRKIMVMIGILRRNTRIPIALPMRILQEKSIQTI